MSNKMRGRESVNSLDDSSVRNSQSGTTTDGARPSSRLTNYMSTFGSTPATAAAVASMPITTPQPNAFHHHNVVNNAANYHYHHHHHHRQHAAGSASLHSTSTTASNPLVVGSTPTTTATTSSHHPTTTQSNGSSSLLLNASASTPIHGLMNSSNNNPTQTGSIYGHSRLNSAASSIMGSTDTINKRETLHSRFDFVKVLGKGTYGKVKLANDKRTGKQVAIKIIHKNRIENKQDLARVRREIEFMSKLNHPHIIKILEVYESSEKIILVMEYASGGELYDYLNERKRVSEVEARGIFRQIVSAVHFLHKNRIVHRDLKLENILIDHNGDIKLADFGLSNNWSPNSLLYTFCGSPLYASPEIVNGYPYFGPEVDCWSLGVLLYTLVYGSMPFQGGDYNRLVKQITDGQFIVPRERSGAFGLIKKCLCVKASKRASIDDIAEHWWVNVGYAYPPVVFYSYVPGGGSSTTGTAQRSGGASGSGGNGIQALGYEGSPKVSPSIPFSQLSRRNSTSSGINNGTSSGTSNPPSAATHTNPVSSAVY